MYGVAAAPASAGAVSTAPALSNLSRFLPLGVDLHRRMTMLYVIRDKVTGEAVCGRLFLDGALKVNGETTID